jgi:uncharacterized membrane protein YheB (UPF0754 family)
VKKRTAAELKTRRWLRRLEAQALANEQKKQMREALERYERREVVIRAKEYLG